MISFLTSSWRYYSIRIDLSFSLKDVIFLKIIGRGEAVRVSIPRVIEQQYRHQLGKEGANLPLISSHFAEATFWRNVPLSILFHFFLSEFEVFYHLDFSSRHYDSFKNVKSDLFTICVRDEQRKVTWENFKFFLRLHFLQLSFLFLPPQKLRLRIVDRIFLKWLSYYLSLGAIVRNHAIVLELYPQIRHGENWRGASIRFYLMARLESSLSLSFFLFQTLLQSRL